MNDNKKISACQITGSIYLIYCNVTDKFYVGQTIQKVSKRIAQHKSCKTSFIGREIQKIGWENNFTYYVLDENVPFINLNVMEKFWIKMFDCIYPKGYNLTHGGRANYTVSDETRKIISEQLTGRSFTEEHKSKLRGRKRPDVAARTGINNPMYGKPSAFKGMHHTEETKTKLRVQKTAEHKKKLSKSLQGKTKSEEHRKNLSRSKKGTPAWNKGKKCPQISAALKGENHPMYGMKGESNPNYGRHHTEETKAKMRAAKQAGRKKKLIKKMIEILRGMVA